MSHRGGSKVFPHLEPALHLQVRHAQWWEAQRGLHVVVRHALDVHLLQQCRIVTWGAYRHPGPQVRGRSTSSAGDDALRSLGSKRRRGGRSDPGSARNAQRSEPSQSTSPPRPLEAPSPSDSSRPLSQRHSRRSAEAGSMAYQSWACRSTLTCLAMTR
jgi:hypothetical protein